MLSQVNTKQELKGAVRAAIIDGLIEHLESSKIESTESVDRVGYQAFKSGASQTTFMKCFYVERMKVKQLLERVGTAQRTPRGSRTAAGRKPLSAATRKKMSVSAKLRAAKERGKQ